MVLIIREKIAAILATAIFLALCPDAEAEGYPQISAECAIVMNTDAQVVFEKNADQRALIASTTKLMTALVALENSQPEDIVEIKAEYCGIEGSSMYLKPGGICTVRELLLGLLLVSGNDAATALAGHVSGSEKAFVRLMNKKAAELGMNGTKFANPHGLDAAGHYSTARDMAKLMCACMDNPEFIELCGTKSYNMGELYFVNHNKLLSSYPGCIAGKTGYTLAAGRCLVTCCKRDETAFICVTLSDPDDWKDHAALYDWAFSKFGVRNITSELRFSVPVISGAAESVDVVPAEEISMFLPKSVEVTVKAEMPQFVFAPIKMGETAGHIWVIINGEIIESCDLIYTQSVELAQQCWNNDSILEKL